MTSTVNTTLAKLAEDGYRAGTQNTREGGADHFNGLAPAKGVELPQPAQWKPPSEEEMAVTAAADALPESDPGWLERHFASQPGRIRTKPIEARRLFQIYYNLGSHDALFGQGPVSSPLEAYPLNKYVQ